MSKGCSQEEKEKIDKKETNNSNASKANQIRIIEQTKSEILPY